MRFPDIGDVVLGTVTGDWRRVVGEFFSGDGSILHGINGGASGIRNAISTGQKTKTYLAAGGKGAGAGTTRNGSGASHSTGANFTSVLEITRGTRKGVKKG